MEQFDIICNVSFDNIKRNVPAVEYMTASHESPAPVCGRCYYVPSLFKPKDVRKGDDLKFVYIINVLC